MPHAEVRRDAELYARLDLLNQQFQELAEARAAATTIAIQQPNPAMLTSAQIDHQIDLTAAILRRRANIASWMRVLNLRYPDFQPAPSQQAIQGILHNQSDATVQAAATALFEKIYQFELEQRREAGESSSTNDAAEPAR